MKRNIAFYLYRLLGILAFPLIVVYFVLRGARDPKYLRRFGERLGLMPASYRQTGHTAIWLHAVSVGEVLSSVELIRRLRAELPAAPIFVSVTTVAGRAAAEHKLCGVADGVFYAPIDYAFAVRRVLRTLRPRAVVVMETEIWPNLWREAKRTGAALVVVNGRISDRTIGRYRRLRWFFRQVLSLPDAILAQGDTSAERYRELDAPAGKVVSAGNLKYDFSPRRSEAPEAIRGFVEGVQPAQVWIAASTMPAALAGDPDEDDVVIEAFRALAASHPGLLLVLAPRKPERFQSAAEALRRERVAFARRSELGAGTDLRLPGVLLLDSIGELSSLFGLADVVFMGGTLASRGGHNILEPAFFGKPVIVGPHMENFPEIARKFVEAGAVICIDGAAGLAGAVDGLLRDAELRAGLGAAARELAESERGATARVSAEIRDCYWRALPRYHPPLPAAVCLWPLSRLWLIGGALKRRRELARRAVLRTPVISVGGLTVGGSGKTPVVLWLAERLAEAGCRPAILTRGYRRRSPERCTILAPGESAPVEQTGDEAQVYLRAGVGPVGIGSDRAGAGREIEERFGPGAFLLDDGFQHHRLERSLDIVVIDALDPFGRGEPFPLGRLRERPEALGRAGAVVIARLEVRHNSQAIEAAVKRHNPGLPVFTSRMAPEGWIDARSGQAADPPAVAAAFCGLGNPGSFWQTLAVLGIRPAWNRAFADHHRYTARELQECASQARARGAGALLTTEKDVMNLPGGWEAAVAPLALLWLKAGLHVDGADDLLALVRARIAPAFRR